MKEGKIISMDQLRAEQCDREVQAVLDKHQCNLVFEQRMINGMLLESRIYSVPQKPKLRETAS